MPPAMHHRLISHPGSVNRIRAMPQQPAMVVTWSEKGTVQARYPHIPPLIVKSAKVREIPGHVVIKTTLAGV